ncbi:heme exporter protein CcmD [Arhodomonas sp. SL1]
MREFLEMGGYAAYVWPSYLLTAAVLVANWWIPLQRRRSIVRRLARRKRQ